MIKVDETHISLDNPDTLIQRFTRQIDTEYDDLLTEIFKKYGYSMEDLIELSKAGRLTAIEYPGSGLDLRTTYCLDGEELFSIEKKLLSFNNDNLYRFEMSYRIIIEKENK